MKTIRNGLACAVSALLVLLAGGAAQAQSDYPSRPIRVIVGFAAGGGNDIFARLIMQKFQEQTGATAIDREQARRRRADFLRIRRASAARRLHRAGRRHRTDGDRRRDLSQSALSSDQELHPAQHDRVVPADSGGAGESSGQDRQGTGGLGESQSRQVELRHLGAALHHCQRTIKAQDRHAGRGDPVQRQQRVEPLRGQRTMPVHHF